MSLAYKHIRYFSDQASMTIGEESVLAADQIMLAHYWWPDRQEYHNGWAKHTTHIWNNHGERAECLTCLMVLQRCERYKDEHEQLTTTD